MGLDKKITRTINIGFPLKRSSRDAFETNDETVKAIADDLKILILTNYGERPGQYSFGANLRALLFEQQSADLNQRIQDAILVAVEKWMPFVVIKEIETFTQKENANLDPNEIEIKVKFSVGATNLTGETAVRIRGVNT